MDDDVMTKRRRVSITCYDNSLSRYLVDNSMTLSDLAQRLGVSTRLISDAYIAKRAVDNNVAKRMREMSRDTVHLLAKDGELTDQLVKQVNESRRVDRDKNGYDYDKSAAIRRKRRVVPVDVEQMRITAWDNNVSRYLQEHNMSVSDLSVKTNIPHYIIVRSFLGLIAATREQADTMYKYTSGAVVLQQQVHESLIVARNSLRAWMHSNNIDYDTLSRMLDTRKSHAASLAYGRVTPDEQLINDLIKISDGVVDWTAIGAKAIIQRTICCE